MRGECGVKSEECWIYSLPTNALHRGREKIALYPDCVRGEP